MRVKYIHLDDDVTVWMFLIDATVEGRDIYSEIHYVYFGMLKTIRRSQKASMPSILILKIFISDVSVN